ncbi:MAG TPA: ribonuclease III [Phycisphaerales bacterium]|nr:ribonuclease III [Phycisphaerales bacterium]
MDDLIRARAETALGYSFRNVELLETALTHASFVEARIHSNERLEFLGDAVLGLVVCQRIFERFPELLEGEMTKIKSLAVSRATCTQIARQLNLGELLIIGKGMLNGESMPASLLAAVLEALIGAVYLDGGIDAARDLIVRHVDPLITQASESGHQQNFKSVLQQHAQQVLGQTPAYRVLDEKGPDHAKCFKICVELNGERFEPSWGQSKKRAEQMAALNALRSLGILEDSADGHVRIVVATPPGK